MSRRGKNLGRWGEERACEFLVRHGFEIIERNYHTIVGEIDIVARKGDDYYFIEVKTRFKGEMSNSTAITARQHTRLGKAVRRYCYARGLGDFSLILAGLIVSVDKKVKKLAFYFFVMY